MKINLGNIPRARRVSSAIIQDLLTEIETENMPNASYILQRIVNRLNAEHMPIQPRRPHIRIMSVLASNQRTIIIEPNAHIRYYKSSIENSLNIIAWVGAVKNIFSFNGLEYVAGSNYFFNHECGIYVMEQQQIVVYRDQNDGHTYQWSSQTESIYPIVGYLTMNHLIESSFNRTLQEAAEGYSSDIPQPPSDRSDPYEF